jgi:hypothetical protein
MRDIETIKGDEGKKQTLEMNTQFTRFPSSRRTSHHSSRNAESGPTFRLEQR